MDQLLRYASIVAMIVFGAIELYYGLSYGDWSLQAFIGIGAALGLFLLTLEPSHNDQHYRHYKH